MTHKEQVLRLLSDNQPHSHHEAYKLGVMMHSRVADLRKDGYMIKCWYENRAWMYQLFGTVRTSGVASDGLADGPPLVRTVLDSGPPEVPSASQTPGLAAEAGGPGGPRILPREGRQLSVFEAA